MQTAWGRQKQRLPVLLPTRCAEMGETVKNCFPTLSAYDRSIRIRITVIMIVTVRMRLS